MTTALEYADCKHCTMKIAKVVLTQKGTTNRVIEWIHVNTGEARCDLDFFAYPIEDTIVKFQES